MKRAATLLVALAALLAGTQAFAGGYGENRWGILVGATSSTTDIKNIDTKNISLYHAGVMAQFPLGLGFSVQPAITYQVKGMNLGQVGQSTMTDITKSMETKVGYAEIPVQFQWGPDLLLFRPYLLAEPFVGYRMNFSSEDNFTGDSFKKIEYGLGLGAGIDVWGLQVSGKWFWNFGGFSQSDLSTTVDTIKGIGSGNNFHGFAVTVALFI
ncbi:MAG: PorT family protein [Bacteroidales bacterium]|nr:PorT family protein [Bacteroidales bacterium]